MEPFDVLFDETDPAAGLPEELSRTYGGDLGLREPCLYANFVSTVDGVVAIPSLERSNEVVAGESEADHFLMGVLRALADCVLIGAGVLRDSPQGTWQPAAVYPSAAEGFAELRSRLGLSERPVVAVLSGRGQIDLGHPLLATGALVLTSARGAERLREVPPATNVVVLGEETRFDGRAAVEALHERGLRRILSEAGPHAFGSLLEAGVVDELFLTISPRLAGDVGEGSRLRLVENADLVPLLELSLVSVRRHGDYLFARYSL